ncbi:hypothetical protein CEP52_010696 [Fusarium oligoseptatum]|uniref:Uncharacterized protein n=1 Tax=Fusarium oligoseptatum TaxID=2604345 RepID=A0A428T6T6_9HYPO|nr:hypothetical protein CEP52_010696 [Fusarium oligoseptatum]
MAFTSTHPRDAWRPSSMTIDEFQAAITDACRNYYDESSRNRLYDKTRVLAVYWEMDEGSGLGNQARRVRDLFQGSYGYNVELLAIQMQDPDPDATITSHLRRGDQGGFQEARARIIDPSPADVLILLDCRVTPGTGIGYRKELIAASAFDETSESGPSSFTNTLVEQLQHAIDNRQIISTAQLYNRLATRHLAVQFRTPQLKAMPYFLQNSGEGQTPIMLAPNMVNESWSPGAVLALFVGPVIVVLHVHLRDAHAASYDQMKYWLFVNRSHNLRRIDIKSVLSSFPNGAIAIISVTLDIWYMLRGHPGISFIGFEENDEITIHNPQVMPRPIQFRHLELTTQGL